MRTVLLLLLVMYARLCSQYHKFLVFHLLIPLALQALSHQLGTKFGLILEGMRESKSCLCLSVCLSFYLVCLCVSGSSCLLGLRIERDLVMVFIY